MPADKKLNMSAAEMMLVEVEALRNECERLTVEVREVQAERDRYARFIAGRERE